MNALGIIKGLSAQEYHSDFGSVSNTMLSAMNKSPAHCYALHLDPDRPESTPTAAMLGGTLAHTAILEPDALMQRYVQRPDGMKFTTKEGIAWRDAQTLEIVGKSDLDTAAAQRAAFLGVKSLANLMQSGDAESSVFWVDAATGLRCRARPDWLHWHGPKRATVLDVKTISDLTADAVQRAIGSYGYHRQAAHYSAGLRAAGVEVEEFVFGFVSSSYPFLAAAFVLDDETAQQGRDEVAELLERFANCQRLGKWPAFGDGYQSAGLPAWARLSNEVEVEFTA